MEKQEFDRISEQIGNLTPEQFKHLVLAYAAQSGQNAKRVWERAVYTGLEKHLADLGVNRTCPDCGSAAIVSNGYTPAGIQRLQCSECGKSFTRFAGTLLEGSRYPWEVWVKVLQGTLKGDSLETTKTILERDLACGGINIKTIFNMRHKLMHAIASVEPPTLSGVIQMDETFIRESQKGQVELVSYIKGEPRYPRYGRHPSKLGTMGPEFATVLTAVDSQHHCVCKLVSLGRALTDAVIDLYEAHCVDAAYLCSDGNIIYKDACDLLDIPHYVRPSNYNTVLENAGYLYFDATKTPEELWTHNRAILERLYRNGEIDYIEHREDLSFREFYRLTDFHGLNLARVNELHNEIKALIEKEMRNVSTKYLQDYLGLLQFRHNWRFDNGVAPVSDKDSEDILKLLVKMKVTQTTGEITATKLAIPKPSGRAIQILTEQTESARQRTANKYLKFSAEEVPSFNTREILLDAPHSRLIAIAKDHQIKGYTKMTHWGLAAAIAKLPDADNIVVDLLMKDRGYMLDDEDIKYVQSQRYMKKNI